MTAEQLHDGLRILLVGPYPPPYGGIGSHLTTLVPGLIERGVNDVRVVCFGPRDEAIQINGATVYYFHPRRHARMLFSPRYWKNILATFISLAGAKLSFRRLLEEAMKVTLINNIADKHGSNVVGFYQSDLSYAMLPCKQIWKRSRGIVLTIFGELYDNPKLLQNNKAFMERLLDSAHAVASSSKHCACSFAKLLGISREIQPVYYGIDLNRFSAQHLRESYRKELGLADNEVLLVFMGRFTEEMGVKRILEVAPMLLEQLPQIKFLLVGGKGSLTDSVSQLANHYPTRIRVLVDVSFELQPAIYAASDIVLAPSHDQHACMGMSIKEAMAASRPVIASDAGGIPEALIHEETGFLVPLDQTKHIDAAAFCQAITALTINSDLRYAMGMAARRRAEELFSMERTIDKMKKLFSDAKPR